MEKTLFLIRGAPGSGKSTLAKALGIKAVCCADDYFIHNGIYNFQREKIKDAHDWCQLKCQRFMQKQINKIIIANTMTAEWELMAYYDLANEFGYQTHSIIIENRHNGTNVHNCPEKTVEMMRERLMNNIKL